VEKLNNKWNCLTYLAVARALGVSIWRIRYAVESGYVSGPSVVLKRRALFSPDQVEGMREFFEMENEAKRAKVVIGAQKGPTSAQKMDPPW